MSIWTGRLSGLILGGIFRGPAGAVIGFVLGYLFYDLPRTRRQQVWWYGHGTLGARPMPPGYRWAMYLDRVELHCVFGCLGYVSRGAGRIDEQRIRLVSGLLDQLQLKGDRREAAEEGFDEGKDYNFRDVRTRASYLCKKAFPSRASARVTVIDLLIRVLYADGTPTSGEQERLLELASSFGMSARALQNLVMQSTARMKLEGMWQRFFDETRTRRTYDWSGYAREDEENRDDETAFEEEEDAEDDRGASASRGGSELEAAYATLGLPADADFETVRKRYRQLMNDNHPDHLQGGKKLSAAEVRRRTELVKAVNAAYDRIKKSQG